ncbi:hypothetical protein SGGMMB4_03517 [Sodalis glossinidius str. 'morsitans']|uniref:Uncharacterized protein n=1 Tax=Sodalis glossinidius (strain morsitans) TaxID=343509 RepID=A0A193QL24_SODGM|nr:hypothetical protein SGGMMB4_03517 [Sodalis glossinidius str. 'morsitans']
MLSWRLAERHAGHRERSIPARSTFKLHRHTDALREAPDSRHDDARARPRAAGTLALVARQVSEETCLL